MQSSEPPANQLELLYIWDRRDRSQSHHHPVVHFLHRGLVDDDFQGNPDAARAETEPFSARNLPRRKPCWKCMTASFRLRVARSMRCTRPAVHSLIRACADLRVNAPSSNQSQEHGTHQARHRKRRRQGIAQAGIRLDFAGHCRERCAIHGAARHGLGRDEHVRGHSAVKGRPPWPRWPRAFPPLWSPPWPGLLVAIPSMFGYNWLVHNLRAFTVELDNFAQELVSKMETEFLARRRVKPRMNTNRHE